MNHPKQSTTAADEGFLVEKVGLAIKELSRRRARIGTLDAEAIAELVRQYNAVRDIHMAGIETPDLHIYQTAWGYQFEHDNFVRLLVVPSAAVGTLQNPLNALRVDDVVCAIQVTRTAARNQI